VLFTADMFEVRLRLLLNLFELVFVEDKGWIESLQMVYLVVDVFYDFCITGNLEACELVLMV